MKWSVLLTTILLAAITGTADAGKKKKGKKPCDGPDNCSEKCSDGVYETWERKNETGMGIERYRCVDKHKDYKWVALVCTQTMGLSNVLTRRYCPMIDGKTCYIDEGHPVKCVADPRWLDTFKILCATDARSDVWSAKIDNDEILNRCPHEQELYD